MQPFGAHCMRILLHFRTRARSLLIALGRRKGAPQGSYAECLGQPCDQPLGISECPALHGIGKVYSYSWCLRFFKYSSANSMEPAVLEGTAHMITQYWMA